jgi:hypothetical protein
MAMSSRGGINKSQAIRDGLREYPDKGPTELARILGKKHGVQFRANSISTLKSRMAHMGQPTAAGPALAASTMPKPASGSSGSAAPGVATMVINLQGYIQRVGKDDLHRLIDTL